VSASSYWGLEAEPAAERTEREYVESIAELFQDATRGRLISDVPFGALLSGGLDSSLNVAYMSELLARPVRTFTIGFEPGALRVKNELDEARIVAQKFTTEHTDELISPESIVESLPRVIYHLDDPIGSPTPVTNYHAARLAKQHGATVVQVGEGSDELFVGYPSMYGRLVKRRRWRRFRQMPRLARSATYRAARPLLAALNNPVLDGATDATLLEQLRRGAEGQDDYWGFGNCFSEVDKRSLLTHAFYEERPGADSYDCVRRQYECFDARFPAGDDAQRMTYLDFNISLAERLLMRVDKMTMAWSVEARVPFLDHLLVELVFSIPQNVKLASGPKSLLKKVSREILPAQIVDSPKMGFPTPVEIFFQGVVREYVLDRLWGSRMYELGLFQKSWIARLLKRFDAGRASDFFLIWNLYVLAEWYDRWCRPARSRQESLRAVAG
jgi:asparagine synthase (glutamine-hydrolysing)